MYASEPEFICNRSSSGVSSWD